ncbi:aldo/keto reductase [Alginatibacterium sediminis]|uniref:Aldo/keto reductase n=1 Tax=Alginatibacterium sediminis TaxID=2164068 RepID=A0A420E9Q3_9ALTE|nr:aldo/keto reductase [Alginatibacterium sediminis]RKF17405.1 aldo/keto reductase [Alginatibacterium sediminis]
MQQRQFGNSALKVSALGFGAGQIGDESLADKQVNTLLNQALDLGINLFDSARGYGVSEERIGKFLKHRRHEFLISTKIGYGIEGTEDWSAECIRLGIDAALKRLQTDHIDIVHLHSCPTSVLAQDAVIQELTNAQRAGKLSLIAYAGENDDLNFAKDSGNFQSLLMSVNICDQRFINDQLSDAKLKGMGIIAKRPVANAPWRFDARPVGHYAEVYWQRWQQMALEFDIDWQELALRFAAFTYGVDSIIVGTTSLDHLQQNCRALENGPLPQAVLKALQTRFLECDQDWVGQI